MVTNNIPEGTLKITLANASQYMIMALFYIIVTKTNALTQTEIGTLSVLSFLASTFSLVTLLALPTALTKFTSEKLGKNQKEEAAATQKTITKAVITLSIIGFAVAGLLSPLISQYLWNTTEYILLIIINFIYALLLNIRNLCDSSLQAIYLFGKIATITITFIVTSRVTAIILVFFDIGVKGVIIGYIIGSIIAITMAIYFLRGKLPKTTKTIPLKPLIYFSFPLFLASITKLAFSWADIMIITSLTGDYSLVGIYSIVVSSVGSLSILYMPMMTTIFPAISAHHGRKKLQNISNILKTTSRIVIFIILPSCIGLAIIAPTALTFFYGSTYAKGAVPLAILSISTIIMALYFLFTTTLTATGKTSQRLKIDIVSAVFLVIMLLSFVPLLETTGAAFARLTTQVVALFLTVYMLKKEIKIDLDKEAIWKSTISTMAAVPFLLAFELIFSTQLSTVQMLALEITTAAGIYVSSLYALKALKSTDFQLLRQAFPKPLTKYINIIERIFLR